MKRVLVGGAGGAPSNGFIESLRLAPEAFYIIGMTSNPYDIPKARADERYLDPYANEPDYYQVLEYIIAQSKPDFLHVQHDFEVLAISQYRKKLASLGVATFLPKEASVETCVDKMKTYRKWKSAGIKVPKTLLIETGDDLARAFNEIGDDLWLRATKGGGGSGSLPTRDLEQARLWVETYANLGPFTAAERLTTRTVTWTSMWRSGELIVAQGRERLYWELGNRTISGVTGITGTGVTVSDARVDEVAQDAILAVDSSPNGIWSVDMTYDSQGTPNPTEINIGRFFTTHLFFTRAGLNLPYILLKLAFDEALPPIGAKLNPLPAGLAWIRGMDTEPVLTTVGEIEAYKAALQETRKKLWAHHSTENQS